MTTDRNDPKLRKIVEDGPLKGQQEDYLVLSEEERAKGFVRPVRRSYKHIACGAVTTMGVALAETYSRNPKFYSGTFCCNCGSHFDLGPPWNPAFLWHPDGEPVGSCCAEEVQMYYDRKKELGEQAKTNREKTEAERAAGSGI